MKKPIAAAVACAFALACGSSSNTPTAPSSSSAAESLELRRETAHFRVFAGQAPDAAIQAAANELETHYARILTDLGVSTVAPVAVRIWQDEASYSTALERYFGRRFQSSGYITGRDEIRVLAVPRLSVNVVHEFSHIVSLYVNPAFANNPRWFWETVALYENNELVDPRTLDYLRRGAFPSLQQLNADITAGQQIYEVGYVLGEFIVSRWGRPAFIRLIETGADLQGTLGVSAASFEAEWQAWLLERYAL